MDNPVFHELSWLMPAPGAVKKVKRIGRGRGSGHGDTATKGHKGQKARSGSQTRPIWFEGGQMPIQRRLPKRGFTQPNRTIFREVSLDMLNGLEATLIDPTVLRQVKYIRGRGPVVVLGVGEITRPITLKVHRITKSAQEKIEAAGGSVELLAIDPEFRRVKIGPAPKSGKADK